MNDMKDILDDLETIRPAYQNTEAIAVRDSYYHSCWLQLKAQHPDLWNEMTEIEMLIGNVTPLTMKDTGDDDADDPEKNNIV